MKEPFWKTKKLYQMTPEEWESLCDGCGFCCLIKLEDSETGKVHKTSVACKLLDIETCRCSDYERRIKKVPTCLKLNSDNIKTIDWLPDTCAYVLVNQGKDLPSWHPLLENTVHESGASVKAFAQSEKFIHPQQIVECIIE